MSPLWSLRGKPKKNSSTNSHKICVSSAHWTMSDHHPFTLFKLSVSSGILLTGCVLHAATDIVTDYRCGEKTRYFMTLFMLLVEISRADHKDFCFKGSVLTKIKWIKHRSLFTYWVSVFVECVAAPSFCTSSCFPYQFTLICKQKEWIMIPSSASSFIHCWPVTKSLQHILASVVCLLLQILHLSSSQNDDENGIL